ncbi:MAG: F0F1 ATP synthase subunit B [Oscillospiraceae bacterium]|jgi:F-type H+-transporting ATPase subunit b
MLNLIATEASGAFAAETGFLSVEVFTIIATLLNTLILFFILKKLLFERVNKMLESRQNDVDKTIEEASNANESANKLKEEYSQKLSEAKEESSEIIKTATKKAQSRYEEIVVDAKKEASSVLDKANSEIEREKKRAVNQIKDEITDMAFMVASKVIEKEIDKKDNERLIDDFISNVGEL